MKSIEIDRSKRLIDQLGTGHNRWHPGIPPILEVSEGEEVVLETRDGVDGQLGPTTTAASMAAMDAGAIHPITGLVLVKGALEHCRRLGHLEGAARGAHPRRVLHGPRRRGSSQSRR